MNSSDGERMNRTKAVLAITSWLEKQKPFHISIFTACLILIVLGAVVNIWMITAILKSDEMRSKMRNKVICSLLCLHLIVTFIVIPSKAATIYQAVFIVFFRNCQFDTFVSLVVQMNFFIANSLVLIMVACFLGEVLSVDLRRYIQPRALTICTYVLLVLPWLLSLFIVPTTAYSHYNKRFGARITKPACFYVTTKLIIIFRIIDTVIPAVPCIVLLVLATVFRYRRISARFLPMREELVDGVPVVVDHHVPYIALVVINILCDALYVSVNASVFGKGMTTYKVYIASMMVVSSKVIFIPLTFLLFNDVRERLKTWRPWYRPGPGIDLTVAYAKEVDS